MSNLALLPLYQVTAGIQEEEDWNLTFFVAQADGVTPIDLSGITFRLKVGNYPTIDFSGDVLGLIVIDVPAEQKAAWGPGEYPFSILAIADDGKRFLTAQSTLTVGAPRSILTTLLTSEDDVAFSSCVVAAGFGSLSMLPVQTGDEAPVASGQPFINKSNYVVIAP